LCVDDSGNVYVSDFMNQRIRKISIGGLVSTVAGSGVAGYVDGLSTDAKFNYPRGICIDASGNLYVGDSWNHRIRKIDNAGQVTTYAGGGNSIGVSSVGSLVDGVDTLARFYTPAGLAMGTNGTIYIADAYNHRIRAIDASRMVTTIAGSGPSGPGNGGYVNGIATSSVFNTPTELFADTINNKLYISDTFNNRVRKLDFNNDYVSSFAGNGTAAFIDSVDTLASFNYPRGIVSVDSAVYVVDYNNHSIRVIYPDNTSGILELESSLNAFVYPNPAENVVSISTKELLTGISVYDIHGKSFGEFPCEGKNYVQIDISRFPCGIYIARLHAINRRSISKIIIHF
jgi:sugar lactone lactonase YvrE